MAEVAEKPKPEVAAKEPIPPDVDARVKRGRTGLQEVQARRLLGIQFANNEHFFEFSKDGTKITAVDTVAVAQEGEKPDHRVRRSHDIITPMLKRKISSATQREPDWESTSATGDPEDYAASRLALRLARAGYPLWGFSSAEQKALWAAMVTEETFGRASFNRNRGPFTDVSTHPEADYEDEEGNKPYEGKQDPENPVWQGRGEIELTIYSGLEVLWEPGVDFERSRWYVVEHARSIEEIEDEPGFIKTAEGKLKPDASTVMQGRATAAMKKGSKLCIVTEYFERPCPKYPEGRWCTYANGRKIFKDERYPEEDAQGNVLDRPCLRRLIYDVDGASDRAKGLVQQLIDIVRQFDQARNKQSEYSQLGLNAQVIAAEGVILTDPTDEPGLVIEYDRSAAAGEIPQWRENVDFPDELFTMAEDAKRLFSEISFDEDIPSQVESGKGIASVVELNRAAWSKFIDDFDTFRSDLMSDCLVLAQRYYEDDRLLKFRGATGWESVGEFKGADLRDQTDVRIRSSATQTMTRPQIEQRIMNLVQTFPGVFPPEVVIEALNSATPEKLIQGYEEDVGRAHRLIGQIRDGSFWDQPLRPALPGEEVLEETEDGKPMVPGWLPRPFDSLPVLKAALENWMKSDDWDRSDEKVKNASLFVYQKVIDLETLKSQRAEEVQNELAEEQGAANAAKPPPKPMPSLPAVTAPEGE